MFIIKFLYLHRNNNHLKLIDMKLATTNVYLLDSDRVCVDTFTVTVIVKSTFEETRIALRNRILAMRPFVDSSFEFDYDLTDNEDIIISEVCI